MWITTLSSVFTVSLSIATLSGVCYSEPGDACDEDTVPGDCKPINQCPQIIIAIQQKKTTVGQVTCYVDPYSPITYVCCPNGKPTKAKVTTPPPIVDRVAEVAPENSRISLKKCFEYAKLVFTRQKSFALINQDVDIDGCVKLAEGLIVNGEPAKLGEFPHMALLGYGTNTSNLDYFCGGSLISEEYVLTAAHCASSANPTYVLLGEFILKDDSDGAKTQLIPVSEFIHHPKYVAPAHYYDIALIRLSRKAVLNALLRPACLHSDQPYDRSTLTATGWGRTDFYESYTSDTLMKVTLSEVNDTICNKTHRDFVKLDKGVLPEQQMCVGKLEGGQDTCQGDSGGPLQIYVKKPHCSYLIVGVTSFGKGCARKNTPGVYARVKYFLQWIEDTVWPPDANNTMADNTMTNSTMTNSTAMYSAVTNNTMANSTTINNAIANSTGTVSNNMSQNSTEYREKFQMFALKSGDSSIITKATHRLVQVSIVFHVFIFKYLFNNLI